jgi:Pregnancy-associated plasma protein-A
MKSWIGALLLLWVILPHFSMGQIYPRCPTENKDPKSREIDPLESFAFLKFQKFIASSFNADTGGIIIIPVVVHVIHLYNDEMPGAETNISNAQVLSQIRILNEDYRRLLGSPGYNENPIGADTEIEFCLANQDPSGGFTTGITRDTTSRSNLKYPEDNAYIKSKSYWPPEQYLNIWTIPSLNANSLGYAQFPWKFDQQPLTDGVVIVHRFFGDAGSADFESNPYNKGRTTTHEVGHWLGLKHIWGDITGCGFPDLPDSIDDTPDALTSNYGCKPGNFSCGSEDMVENYLDYSNDSCMNIFTLGQKKMMRYILTSGDYPFRSSVRASEGSCNSIVESKIDLRLIPTSDPNILILQGLEPSTPYSIEVVFSSGKRVGTFQGISRLDGTALLRIEDFFKGMVILRVAEQNKAPRALKAVLIF